MDPIEACAKRSSLTTVDEIRSYAELETDWDSYGADPIPPEVRRCAVEIAEVLARYPIVPTPIPGGINLEWDMGDGVVVVLEIFQE